jgi:hypothetical protein
LISCYGPSLSFRDNSKMLRKDFVNVESKVVRMFMTD